MIYDYKVLRYAVPPTANITYERINETSTDLIFNVTTGQNDPAPTFICASDGIPMPNISWSVINEGQNFPPGVSVESSSTTQQGLVWNRVLDYMDSGLYECISQNTLGQSRVVLDLLVRCK